MATATATPVTETTLFLKRTFKASREKVFDAWTKPDMLKRWFAGSDDMVGSVAEVDLRVGGRFRMGMKHVPTGKEHIATGVYKEVRFPERLVFTWKWEEKPDDADMQITIQLTELPLRFLGIATNRQRFSCGLWRSAEARVGGCFKNLEKALLS